MSLALTSTIYSPTAATFDAAATAAALWVLLLPLRVFLFVVFIYFDYIFSIFFGCFLFLFQLKSLEIKLNTLRNNGMNISRVE